MASSRPAFRYQITILLTGLAMIAVLLSSLTGFWHLEIGTGSLLKYTFWTLLFAWITWLSPISAAVLTVLGGMTAYAAYNTPDLARYFQQLAGATGALAQELMRLNFQAKFDGILGPFFLCGVALLASLLLVWETFTRGRPFWSIVLGMVVFGTEWAWFYDAAASSAILFAVLVFMIWAVGQAAVRDARWNATGRKVGNRILLLVPVAAIFATAFIAALLPDHYEPINTGVWGERLQDAIPALKNMRGGGVAGGSGRFSLSMTGFNPSTLTLGGPVKLDDTVALHVTVDQPLQETLYLRGNTFTEYTGRVWERGEIPIVNMGSDDSVAVQNTTDMLSRYLTLQISHDLSLGYTLFSTLEPLRVQNALGTLRTDADGNLWSDRVVRRNSPYEVTARVPEYSAEQIRLLGTGAPQESDQIYLAVPSMTPARVKELATKLTAMDQSSYDKALTLERYLRQFPYDLNASSPPGGRDFVDYFLFDAQRGYCIYSASAMTVMLRELGIPARLVQGFGIPAAAEYTKRSDGRVTYAVKNAFAHAWVEAKFPGYGWVTFDPTPRTDLPVIDRSTLMPKAEEQTGTVNTGDPTEIGKRPGQGMKEVPEDVDIAASPAKPAKTTWPWTLGALLLVVGLLYLLYRRLQAQERLVANADPQLVQEVWTKTDGLLALFGFARKPHETPQEYAAVVGGEWPDLKEPVAELAADYNQVRYGPADRPASGEAGTRTRGFWEKLHGTLFDRLGWRTYLWRRLRGRVSAKEAMKKRS
ncbi:MAG: DUF3488 and DUF4129 domain-containing transglutaminase family protein [Mycobacterium leprae]